MAQNQSSLAAKAADRQEQERQLHRQQLMILDIDGVLTSYNAAPIDILVAAQALAVSAVGDLTNKTILSNQGDWAGLEALHRFADSAAEQIRAAMHCRIDEGAKPDW